MAVHQRPLSPHLQVYKPQITMVMSIMHRATGVFLALGAFALMAWLLAVAGDGQGFDQFNRFAASLPGMLLMVVLVFSLMYHLFNGIRHLLWDIGWGFEIPQFYASGWIVLGLTAAFTAGLVVLALLAGGVA